MKDFRKAKNISKELEKYYREYYERNTSKFIGKWRITMEDLDSIFTNLGVEYQLIGQVSDNTFILNKVDDETKWFITGSVFFQDFEKKKE